MARCLRPAQVNAWRVRARSIRSFADLVRPGRAGRQKKGYPEECDALGTHLEGTLLSVGPCDLKAREFQLMIVFENMLHFKYTYP